MHSVSSARATARSRGEQRRETASLPARTADPRRQPAAALTSPALAGHRASAWLAAWDKGSRATRVRVLEAFLSLHRQSSSETISQDLGDAAPLLFARITAWLRLTYCTLQRPTASAGAPAPTSAVAPAPASASALVLMVESLSLFVRGVTYATQLVESGVAATLTDCLERGSTAALRDMYVPLRTDEKTAVLLLLLYVASTGRTYREMICDEQGLLSLLHVMEDERDAEVASLLTELFVLLGRGNNTLAPMVQTGLFRLIMNRCAQLRAHAQDERRPPLRPDSAATDSYSTAPATGSKHSVSAAEGVGPLAAERRADGGSVDDIMTLQACRALRATQVAKESHHFSACWQRAEGEQRRRTMDYAGALADEDDGGEGAAPSATLAAHRAADPSLSEAPGVDAVPVVCLFPDCAAAAAGPAAQAAREVRFAAYGELAEFRPVTSHAFVDTLFDLILESDSTQLKVEGSELLMMAAKNAELLPPVLNRALDVLDDDMLLISDAEDAEVVSRRHHRQLTCGRLAVQIILSRPLSSARRAAVVELIALRSAHVSLLKYLRLTELGDAAAAVDCCHALQLLARVSDAAQQGQLGQPAAPPPVRTGATAVAQPSTVSSVVLSVGGVLRSVLGGELYVRLLEGNLTEEECLAMVRAAKASTTTVAPW